MTPAAPRTPTLPFSDRPDLFDGVGEPDDVAPVRAAARSFVAEILEPAEAEIDRIPDPVDAYASEPFVTAMRESARRGFTRAALPVEWGGPGMSVFAQLVLAEELAAGAPGLGSHVLAGGFAAGVMVGSGAVHHPEYARYVEGLGDDASGPRGGAWAATEPTVGSDILSVTDAAARYTTTARACSGGYVLQGHKSTFVSNAYCADQFVVMAHLEDCGTAVFLVPADAPGVSVGDPLDKVGLRALNQAPLKLDGVHVPEHALAVEPGRAAIRFTVNLTCRGNVAVGLQSVGVAQRAFDVALEHAKSREQGGSVLVEHQLIATKLVTAFHRISASRSYLYRAAHQLDARRIDPLVCYSARIHASTMAIEVVEQMTQILGGYGIAKSAPLERYYRDVKLLTIADGTVEKVGLLAARYL